MASSASPDFWSQWWRVGGVLGVVFTALFFIGIFIFQGDAPTLDDPITEIRAFFADDGNRYLTGDYISALGFVFFFFPFLLVLRSLLAMAEGGSKLFSWAAFAGGFSLLLFGGVASVSWGALAMGAAGDPSVSDSSVQTLMYIDAFAFSSISLFIALMVFASSAVIFRTGVLWRWLAAPGAAVGVLGVIGGSWVIDGDPEGPLAIIFFLSLVGFLLWILLVSINMILIKELPHRSPS